MLKLTVVVLLVYISWFGHDMVNALSTRPTARRYKEPIYLLTHSNYYLTIEGCHSYFIYKTRRNKYSKLYVKEVKARRPQKADTRIVTISSRQSNHTLCIDENNNIVPLWFSGDGASKDANCMFEELFLSRVPPHKDLAHKRGYRLFFKPLILIGTSHNNYQLGRKLAANVTDKTKFKILQPIEYSSAQFRDISFIDE